jgi:hypothetical protein
VPLRELVVVDEQTSRLQVDLAAHDGLFVRGRVVGPDREPVVDAHLFCWTFELNSESDDHGNFSVGPLLPGMHHLRVSGPMGSALMDMAVEVEPGEDDLTLTLGLGARVSGVLLDRASRPTEGILILQPSDWPHARIFAADARHDGRFEFLAVDPGTYLVVATDFKDGFATTSSFSLESGGEIVELDVLLGPSARLAIRAPEDTVPLVRPASLPSLFADTVIVAPGACEVSLYSADATVLERRAVIAVEGETLEVVLGEGGG